MFVMGISAWFIVNGLRADTWLMFFAVAEVYTVIYFVFAYLFMMNAYERDMVAVPAKRVLRKLNILK